MRESERDFPSSPCRVVCARCLLTALEVCALSAVCPATVEQVTVCVEPDLRIPTQDYGPGQMLPLTIPVTAHLTITDVDVYFDIVHSNVADLQIILTHPSGVAIVLKETWIPAWRDPWPNMTATIFDDAAQTYLPDAEPPYTGRFRPPPSQELAHFTGLDTAGSWLITIHDGYDGDFGFLERCELRFTGIHAPEPGLLLLLLSGLAPLCRRSR